MARRRRGSRCTPWATIRAITRSTDRSKSCSGSRRAYPAANLEPYYTGWNHSINRPGGETPAENSERDNYFARAMMYGSVLSGALAGPRARHGGVRRHEHRRAGRLAAAHLDRAALRVRRADAAPARVRAVGRRSLPAAHARFAGPRAAQHSGRARRRSRRLVVSHAHRGARFRARVFREQGAQRVRIKGFTPGARYSWTWFDPRSGEWGRAATLQADAGGHRSRPLFPRVADKRRATSPRRSLRAP